MQPPRRRHDRSLAQDRFPRTSGSLCAIHRTLLSTPKQGCGEKDAALLISNEDYMVLLDIGGATQNPSDWYLHLTETRGVPAANVLWY